MSASPRKVLAVGVADSEKDTAYAFTLWRLVCSLLLVLTRTDGQIFSYATATFSTLVACSWSEELK